MVKIGPSSADDSRVRRERSGRHRQARRIGVVLAVALAIPIAAAASPALGVPSLNQADLDQLEARARTLTAAAESGRDAVLQAASAATSLRLDLDALANVRDAAQAKVDAALVALYEQSTFDTGSALSPLQNLDPALARVYGTPVTRQQSAVTALDDHARTLATLSLKAETYHHLLIAKADRVYAAEDAALTVLATARDEYARQQRAADVARLDAEAAHLRAISDQVSTTVATGVGRRGEAALGRQGAVIALLTAAGSGYPAGYGPTGQTFDGTSSWYGPGFEGLSTATGAPFDPEKLTCAMKSVPLGTVVRVSYGSRAVDLLVNDRGPYVGDRIIDVSRAGARALGFDGLAQVHIEVLGPLAATTAGG